MSVVWVEMSVSITGRVITVKRAGKPPPPTPQPPPPLTTTVVEIITVVMNEKITAAAAAAIVTPGREMCLIRPLTAALSLILVHSRGQLCSAW